MFLRHPLGSPMKITIERLKELLDKKELSRDDEQEIVTGHISMLLSMARKWSIIAPQLKDLFVADGLYAMLIAIRNRHKVKEGYNLTQYICIHITTAFKRTVANQQVVKRPIAVHTNDKKQIKNGKEYVVKKQPPMKRCKLPELLSEKTSSIELREIFKLCIKNTHEECVLELKKFGYNIGEIAEKMKIKRAEVAKTLETLEFRLREMLA